jgi:hypothetical protein
MPTLTGPTPKNARSRAGALLRQPAGTGTGQGCHRLRQLRQQARLRRPRHHPRPVPSRRQRPVQVRQPGLPLPVRPPGHPHRERRRLARARPDRGTHRHAAQLLNHRPAADRAQRPPDRRLHRDRAAVPPHRPPPARRSPPRGPQHPVRPILRDPWPRGEHRTAPGRRGCSSPGTRTSGDRHPDSALRPPRHDHRRPAGHRRGRRQDHQPPRHRSPERHPGNLPASMGTRLQGHYRVPRSRSARVAASAGGACCRSTT